MPKKSELNRFLSKLSLRDKILLTLLSAGALVEEIIIEVSDPLGIRASGRGYSFENAGYFKEKKKTLNAALNRFLKNKLIEIDGTRKHHTFVLTEKGLNELFSKFPKLKYGNRPWDGYWRVVFYDVAEAERKLRERLRHELKRLDFKYLQKSVWLTPFPVEKDLEKFLKREKLWSKILVFKALLPKTEGQKFFGRHFRKKYKPKTKKDGSNSLLALLTNPFLPKGL